MNSLLFNNRQTLPYIKVEDDNDIIIDLDAPSPPSYSWDEEMRKLLSQAVNGKTLIEDILKQYTLSLQKQMQISTDKVKLKEKIVTHLNFFKLHYMEINDYMSTSNYYELMEDILALYCTLELDVVRKKHRNRKKMKKKFKDEVTERIFSVLAIFLAEKEMHIMHVLLKLKYTCTSEACCIIMKRIFKQVLFRYPVQCNSDESFSRKYIIFLMCKELVPPEEHEMMDLSFFYRFKRPKESIKTNKVLSSIFTMDSASLIDTCNFIMDLKGNVVTKYFNYMKRKKRTDELAMMPNDISISFGDMSVTDDLLNKPEFHISEPFHDVLPNSTDAKEVIDLDDEEEVLGTPENNKVFFVYSSGEDSDIEMKYMEMKKVKKKKRLPITTEIIDLDDDSSDELRVPPINSTLRIDEKNVSETHKQEVSVGDSATNTSKLESVLSEPLRNTVDVSIQYSPPRKEKSTENSCESSLDVPTITCDNLITEDESSVDKSSECSVQTKESLSKLKLTDSSDDQNSPTNEVMSSMYDKYTKLSIGMETFLRDSNEGFLDFTNNMMKFNNPFSEAVNCKQTELNHRILTENRKRINAKRTELNRRKTQSEKDTPPSTDITETLTPTDGLLTLERLSFSVLDTKVCQTTTLASTSNTTNSYSLNNTLVVNNRSSPSLNSNISDNNSDVVSQDERVSNSDFANNHSDTQKDVTDEVMIVDTIISNQKDMIVEDMIVDTVELDNIVDHQRKENKNGALVEKTNTHSSNKELENCRLEGSDCVDAQMKENHALDETNKIDSVPITENIAIDNISSIANIIIGNVTTLSRKEDKVLLDNTIQTEFVMDSITSEVILDKADISINAQKNKTVLDSLPNKDSVANNLKKSVLDEPKDQNHTPEKSIQDEFVTNSIVEEIDPNKTVEEVVSNNSVEEVACNNVVEDVCNKVVEEVLCNNVLEVVYNNVIENVVCNKIVEEVVSNKVVEEVVCNKVVEEVVSNKDVVCNKVVEEAVCNQVLEEAVCNKVVEEAICNKVVEEVVTSNIVSAEVIQQKAELDYKKETISDKHCQNEVMQTQDVDSDNTQTEVVSENINHIASDIISDNVCRNEVAPDKISEVVEVRNEVVYNKVDSDNKYQPEIVSTTNYQSEITSDRNDVPASEDEVSDNHYQSEVSDNQVSNLEYTSTNSHISNGDNDLNQSLINFAIHMGDNNEEAEEEYRKTAYVNEICQEPNAEMQEVAYEDDAAYDNESIHSDEIDIGEERIEFGENLETKESNVPSMFSVQNSIDNYTDATSQMKFRNVETFQANRNKFPDAYDNMQTIISTKSYQNEKVNQSEYESYQSTISPINSCKSTNSAYTSDDHFDEDVTMEDANDTVIERRPLNSEQPIISHDLPNDANCNSFDSGTLGTSEMSISPNGNIDSSDENNTIEDQKGSYEFYKRNEIWNKSSKNDSNSLVYMNGPRRDRYDNDSWAKKPKEVNYINSEHFKKSYTDNCIKNENSKLLVDTMAPSTSHTKHRYRYGQITPPSDQNTDETPYHHQMQLSPIPESQNIYKENNNLSKENKYNKDSEKTVWNDGVSNKRKSFSEINENNCIVNESIHINETIVDDDQSVLEEYPANKQIVYMLSPVSMNGNGNQYVITNPPNNLEEEFYADKEHQPKNGLSTVKIVSIVHKPDILIQNHLENPKIMYTSKETIALSEDDFKKRKESVSDHEFQDSFSGPLIKINGANNHHYDNYDLFESEECSEGSAVGPVWKKDNTKGVKGEENDYAQPSTSGIQQLEAHQHKTALANKKDVNKAYGVLEDIPFSQPSTSRTIRPILVKKHNVDTVNYTDPTTLGTQKAPKILKSALSQKSIAMIEEEISGILKSEIKDIKSTLDQLQVKLSILKQLNSQNCRDPVGILKSGIKDIKSTLDQLQVKINILKQLKSQTYPAPVDVSSMSPHRSRSSSPINSPPFEEFSPNTYKAFTMTQIHEQEPVPKKKKKIQFNLPDLPESPAPQPATIVEPKKFSLNLDKAYEQLKRKQEMRGNQFKPRNRIRCNGVLPNDWKIYRGKAIVRIPRYSEAELLLNYRNSVLKEMKHYTKRSCLLSMISSKESPVASPSRVPDPEEYLKDNPVTGNHNGKLPQTTQRRRRKENNVSVDPSPPRKRKLGRPPKKREIFDPSDRPLSSLNLRNT